MRSLLRTTVVSTGLALSLASCSGAGSDAEPEPSDAPTATSAEPGTPPGTDLSFGDPAALVWQPSSEVEAEIELSVEAVAEQRPSVFEGWLRDDVMAASRPYFVTVSMTNAGDVDLAGLAVPLYLRDDHDKLGAPWTLGGDFTPCQSGPLPTPFASGDEIEMCLVYLVPDGARIRDLVFEPTEGFDPISWTGEVEKPTKPGSGTDGKQSRKDRRRG